MKLIISLIFFLQLNAFAKDFIVKAFEVNGNETMVFKPSFLQIEAGDRVTFQPMESFAHQPQSIFSPKGQRSWKAKKGKSITVTFEKEGIHIYNCKFHFVMGMAGIIQVGKATNYSQAKEFLNTYQSNVAIRKDRLNQIFLKIKPN